MTHGVRFVCFMWSNTQTKSVIPQQMQKSTASHTQDAASHPVIITPPLSHATVSCVGARSRTRDIRAARALQRAKTLAGNGGVVA